MMIGCQDPTFFVDQTPSDLMVEAPFFLRYLSGFVFQRKHAGAWRFCPTDYRNRIQSAFI